MSLEIRIVVITGAAGGLGRVVAQRLAESGARLALVSSSGEKLAAMRNQFGGHAVKAK